MAVGTIHLETELPTSAERVWDAMKQPASFLYVTRGLLGFPALAGRTDSFRAGEVVVGRLFLLNVLPVNRHTIEFLDVDEQTRSLSSHEYGGLLQRWDHTLHGEAISETRCRYSDTVEIEAGSLTPVVCQVATVFYRYRQRRWTRLVQKHLLPAGPSA
jgi:hypothetical protein